MVKSLRPGKGNDELLVSGMYSAGVVDVWRFPRLLDCNQVLGMLLVDLTDDKLFRHIATVL